MTKHKQTAWLIKTDLILTNEIMLLMTTHKQTAWLVNIDLILTNEILLLMTAHKQTACLVNTDLILTNEILLIMTTHQHIQIRGKPLIGRIVFVNSVSKQRSTCTYVSARVRLTYKPLLLCSTSKNRTNLYTFGEQNHVFMPCSYKKNPSILIFIVRPYGRNIIPSYIWATTSLRTIFC